VPQPELQFAGLQRVLEGVVEFVHWESLTIEKRAGADRSSGSFRKL
jgi:hypothetical protein